MIRIYYGTPGAGKSYGALRDLVDELVYGSRLIVTNLSIDVGRLNAWVQKEHPDWMDDINRRLRLITEEQTSTFYCFRSVSAEPLDCPAREESLRGRHVDYTVDTSGEASRNTANNGVSYYIDEAHIKFDSREWKEAGPELTYYASQHRKVCDECVFITQHPDMLNNRMRMLCQEFWSFNNVGMEKVYTFFMKPSFFTCEVHRKVPQGAFVPAPMAVHRYRLNKSLADCYDTSAGVGIKGRNTPEKKTNKGYSLLWLAIPIVIGGYLLTRAPEWVVKGANKITVGTETMKGATASKQTAPPAASTLQGPKPLAGLQRAEETVVPYVKSYALRGSDIIVTLSDGRELTGASGVVYLARDYVLMSDGTKYQIRRGYSGRTAAQPPAH